MLRAWQAPVPLLNRQARRTVQRYEQAGRLFNSTELHRSDYDRRTTGNDRRLQLACE